MFLWGREGKTGSFVHLMRFNNIENSKEFWQNSWFVADTNTLWINEWPKTDDGVVFLIYISNYNLYIFE